MNEVSLDILPYNHPSVDTKNVMMTKEEKDKEDKYGYIVTTFFI